MKKILIWSFLFNILLVMKVAAASTEDQDVPPLPELTRPPEEIVIKELHHVLEESYNLLKFNDPRPIGWDEQYDNVELAHSYINLFCNLADISTYHSNEKTWLMVFHFISLLCPQQLVSFTRLTIDMHMLTLETQGLSLGNALDKLSTVLQHMRSLKKLKIYIPKIMTAEDAVITHSTREVLEKMQLEELSLQGFFFDEKNLESLLKSQSQLQILCLDNASIDGKILQVLCANLPPETLETLCLMGNPLTCQDLITLCNFVEKQKTMRSIRSIILPVPTDFREVPNLYVALTDKALTLVTHMNKQLLPSYAFDETQELVSLGFSESCEVRFIATTPSKELACYRPRTSS